MKALLFDLDGVLYQDNAIIDGAAETLDWARQQSLPYLFVTNTSSRPRSAIVAELRGYGIDITEDIIITPAVAACQWLRQHQARRLVLCVSEKTRDEFAGFELLSLDEPGTADAVIVGDMGESWDFRTLNNAFRHLQASPGCALLALGMTRYWRAPDGLRLDTGPFVRALEFASDRQAEVQGKPAAHFFTGALQQLGLEGRDVLMVGDDIRADIGGAQESGLRTALVKTGKFSPADLDGDIQPDIVMDSIAGLPASWPATT